MYVPDLVLALGLLMTLLLGWRRGPGWLAALVGLAAVGGAAALLLDQPTGTTGGLGPWAQVGQFVVRLDRRMDPLAWASALGLLGGLAVWFALAALTRPRPGAPHPAWGVATALAAGLALLNLILAADGVVLAGCWLAALPAIYILNLLAGAAERAGERGSRPAAPTPTLPPQGGGSIAAPVPATLPLAAWGLGAGLVAGAALLGVVLAAGRIGGAGYALIDLPWYALGPELTLLLVAALLVQLGQWPLLGLTTGGAAISRGLLVPLPALYVALRVQGLLAASGESPPAWNLAWTVLAGAGALGGLGALAAWGAVRPERRLALVTAAGGGLVAWGLGLHTAAGQTAAVALVLTAGLAHLGLDPRLGRWRLVALASLGGVPLLAGFGGLWLLARALDDAGRPALGLLPLLIAAVGALALVPGLTGPLVAARARGAGGLLALALLALGGLPGSLLALARLPLNDGRPDGPVQAVDWGLAAVGPGAGAAWPATALAGLLAAGLLGMGVLVWRHRRAGPGPVAPRPTLAAEALVPVARALRLDRSGRTGPIPDPAHPPLAGLIGRAAGVLGALGNGVRAAEGAYYLLFTVLMLLVILLALTR